MVTNVQVTSSNTQLGSALSFQIGPMTRPIYVSKVAAV